MALLTPHWQALTPTTRQGIQIAAVLPFIRRYYLAGGTGLALYLGHRFSIDLYFILQQTPLERLFEAAAVKYARGRTFAVSAVRALTYFADAETAPMPRMIRRVSWPTFKRFLEQESLTAGRKRLNDLWSA